MLGQIMNLAVKAGVLSDDDFMQLSEREVMEKLDTVIEPENTMIEPVEITVLARMYKTFRTMTKIEHTSEPLGDDYFCVNLKVKQRYINPLVVCGKRLSEVSEKARRIIDDFKTYSDTPYGCVKLV